MKTVLRRLPVVALTLILVPAGMGAFALALLPDDDDKDRSPPGSFPRRLLAIGVHNCPNTIPIGYGARASAFDRIVSQLGQVLRVPEDQVTFASDRGPNPYPPTKSFIESTIVRFLDTSGPQDRIVLLFVGHAVELDGTPYLVPLFGDPEQKETLMPLSWLYERLEKCKARQKLLILDVCRYDPHRGTVAPMGEKTGEMLAHPPKGVQVLSSCSVGQHSCASSSKTIDADAGFFLSSITRIKTEGGLRGVEHKREESLPAHRLHEAMKLRTRPKAAAYLKKEQIPRLAGSEAESNLKYDPQATGPRRTRLELPEEYKSGIAEPAVLEAVLTFPNGLPPLRAGVQKLSADALPPYPKDTLLSYKDDGKDSPFREAVRAAGELLVKHGAPFQDTFPPLPKNPQQFAQVDAQLQALQKDYATNKAKLAKAADGLEGLAPARAKECKLWQANYDYALARLEIRQAQLLEYNLLLGQLRTGKLPALDPQVHREYKLGACAKLNHEDAKNLTDKAGERLKKLTQEHKGSPWAALARHDLVTTLGLEWHPY